MFINSRISSRSRSRRLSAVFAAAGVGLIGIGMAGPATVGANAAPVPGSVTGDVFRDYNGSGAKDGIEPGQQGIEVRAFDATGAPVGPVATSASDGTYTINTGLPSGAPVRVEFTIPAAYNFLQSGPAGAGSGTSVQFTTVDQTASFGVWNPSEYCQANPTLVLSCHAFGDPVNGDTKESGALKTFPANATGSHFDGTNSTSAVELTTNKAIGTTFGVAYNRSTKDTYTSAFQRAFAGFGPGGPGAVYKVAPNGATTLLATVPNAGVDARTGYAPNVGGPNADWLSDTTFDQVGKISLGGLVISDDESTLWVVNLNDRSLYPISVTDGTVGAPVAIPLGTGGAVACAAADARPMALTNHDGKLYVGVTCTGQSTNVVTDLALSVYAFDPAGRTFAAAPVFQSGIDPVHGQAGNGCGPDVSYGSWSPWTSADIYKSETNHQCAHPQPWLSSLAFDRGNLILGLRDRFGDQAAQDHPVGGQAVVAGDILRACGSVSTGWTLEANGSCGGVTGSGVGNNQGPAGGEFYGLDQFFNGDNHEAISTGSVLQLAAQPTVIYTVFDPSQTNDADWRSGGVHTDSNTDGSNKSWFELYDKCDSSGIDCPAGRTSSGNFGKANSLGEIEAMCDHAPIEIGNRVWLDLNGNGQQDAGEAGVGGVTVSLQRGSTTVATTATAADGTYLFNATNVDGGVTPLTAYTVSLTNAADFTGTGPLAAYGLTVTDAGTNDAIDSDAAMVGAVPTIAVTTGRAGANDHTLDFGFRQTYALGNRVFADLDNSGDINVADGATPGIAGVTVNLYRVGETKPLATTTTDPDGYYCFEGLSAGQYVVEVAAANFNGPLAGLASSTGPAQKADPNTDVDNDDNGLDSAGAIRSGVIALGAGEPTSEVDGAARCAGTMDNHTNLTVDFGFHGAAALGNYVWIDTNHDGLQNEPAANGVNGVTVTVKDQAGKVAGTAITANDPKSGAPGYYYVNSLAPGTYTITFTTLPAGFAPTKTAVGSDRTIDSDGLVAGPVTLVTNDDIPTFDLGLFAPTAVGDSTWIDENGNGVFDATEPVLPGVTVTLLDSAGQPVTIDADGHTLAPQVTGDDGRYLFANLPAGSYQVRFTPPAGYAPTISGAGNDPAIDSNAPLATSVTLAAGQQDLTLDAGFIAELASVSDRVWLDANKNGVQDPDERGFGGVAVNLFDGNGAVVGTQTTDSAGNYAFINLAPGTYTVQFVVPTGYRFTSPALAADDIDSDADPKTGFTVPVTLVGGEMNPTVDAGIYLAPVVAADMVTPAATPTTTTTTPRAVSPTGVLPRTGGSPFRLLEIAGLLAEFGAVLLYLDSRKKRRNQTL